MSGMKRRHRLKVSSVVVVGVGVDVLGGVAELGLVLAPYSRWIASTSASASFT